MVPPEPHTESVSNMVAGSPACTEVGACWELPPPLGSHANVDSMIRMNAAFFIQLLSLFGS
jgi:hypothetical protein